ncbi:alanine--tRNA ligase [Mucilaginibacter arboris]|uniref:Alanine--tRNA ligase n=1 Tax=Mucilaginibacter arboris TaxID=2682090 RepID=A0A7K1SXD3_9SPHI|nr:alanine--tRNA ligase [Mucilaginibacter arboris]MVN21963.1 alanine--tRNA ligase [Mucilaginibacter arboris]
MLTASQIRQQFLDFFASKQHQIVPSAPIVVKNDPTLMFTNAGMNQFKSIFLGEETAKFPRVADTQRCLRVSGKHNDLEEVGIDTYHHTMFEMLGNWSFGDYFKKEAIAWSWELLTEVYKIDKDRLYVTYFEGDEKEGLEKDQEAYDLWKQFLPEDHILPGNKKDNFWEMGETGPCGPCSEIHYDNRSEEERGARSGAELVNADDPQVIEIWNNVFMQFNRLKDGSLQPLPNKHVDTGMGFERLVRVLQGKSSNYDTDVFQPLIQFIAEKSGKAYVGSAGSSSEGWNEAVAMRVMADHIRAISFAIADGQLPSNNKAGYVIRRILRRAVRYTYQYLNFKEPFLNTLVLLLAEQFKDVFPNLYEQKDFVQKVVLEEEVSFLRTLENGMQIFDHTIIDRWAEANNQIFGVNKIIQDAIQTNQGIQKVIEASNAFQALGVIQDSMQASRKMQEMFQAGRKMQDALQANTKIQNAIDAAQKLTSVFQNNSFLKFQNSLSPFFEAASRLESNPLKIPGDVVFKLQDTYGFPKDLTELMARETGSTIDTTGYENALQEQKNRSRAATAIDTGDWISLKEDDTVEFTGYTETETIAHIIKYRKVKAKGKEQFQLVLDKTPFYAESGGQVGDTGDLIFPDGEIIPVTDTKKENGLIVHFVDKMPEDPSDIVTAYVDPERRLSIENNHSATHLLHAALKEVLGSHVNQKGSLVSPDYLRFDFSHFAKVSDEEISSIEAVVNRKIRENVGVIIQTMSFAEASQTGAMALFGEKYGDVVRVVTMDEKFSIELCGGTHVKATGQIGFFKIVAESAVAAGVRRIEAITSVKSEEFIHQQNEEIKALKELLKNPKDLTKSLEQLLEENASLKKEAEKAVLDKVSAMKKELAARHASFNGINFISEEVDLPNAEAVKSLAYQTKDILTNLVLVLGATIEGKPNLTVMISENLVKEKGLDARTFIKELAKEIQGGGGGQPFYATAGGKNAAGLKTAIEKAKLFIHTQV